MMSTAATGYSLKTSLLPFLLLLLSVACHGTEMKLQHETMTGLCIEALSRGRGVPPQTRQAYLKIKDLLSEAQKQGMTLKIREKMIGLEGESRLCVEFSDPTDASALFEKIESMATGIDLLNIEARRCQD